VLFKKIDLHYFDAVRSVTNHTSNHALRSLSEVDGSLFEHKTRYKLKTIDVFEEDKSDDGRISRS
jgi:hypothetical protein